MTQLPLFQDFPSLFAWFIEESVRQSKHDGPLVGCRGVGEFERIEWSDELRKLYGFPECIGNKK